MYLFHATEKTLRLTMEAESKFRASRASVRRRRVIRERLGVEQVFPCRTETVILQLTVQVQRLLEGIRKALAVRALRWLGNSQL